MQTFERGDIVKYLPYHANGNPYHKDCEVGTVTFTNARYVFVKFGEGEAAKACEPGTLIRWVELEEVKE